VVALQASNAARNRSVMRARGSSKEANRSEQMRRVQSCGRQKNRRVCSWMRSA
jgi:hypothetical protein